MTLRPASMARPPFAGSRSASVIAIICALLAAAMFFNMVANGMVVMLFGLAFAASVAYIAWRWPLPTIIAMMALMPLSRFISFAAFSATDSTSVLQASQIWKDAVLVVLVVRMAHEAFLRGSAPKLHYLDILVGAYMLLTAVYVLYPGDDQQSSYLVRLLAFRQDAFYLLAYFVGRSLTFEQRHLKQMFAVLAGVSVVISAVAVWQFLAPETSNRVFESLGYSRFTEAVGTPHETELVRSRLLSSGELPRASSLFLADLGLAFFQVLMIPLAAGLFFCLRGRSNNMLMGAFLALMIGTMALTVSRAPMLGAALGLGVLIIASRSFLRASWVGIATVAVALLFVILSGFRPSTLGEMFSTQESSSFAHTQLIEQSTELLGQNPLGLGLGNGSHVSILASNISSTALPAWATETWYLQIGLEMGIAGMLLFAAVLVTATVASLITAFRVRDVWLRALSLGVAGAGIGFILVGAFHPVWSAVQVAFLFWFFAGIAVRACDLDQKWAGTEESEA